jgi:hypothetical protein
MIDPDSLWDTRLQLHWAAQAAAGVGRTLLPKEPDFSHESFTWSAEHHALLGGGDPRAGIRLFDMTLVVVEANRVVDELPMNGRTLDDGFSFFERCFASGALNRPYVGMPDHPVAHGAAFHANSEALSELDRRYAEAAIVLDEVRRTEVGAGALRCWPHHFDLATLIAIRGEGEKAHTIGAGMTPGDESYRHPYYYVTPWPYPKDAPLPALCQGSWHTQGWVGAVRPAAGDGAVEFIRDAIRHCRELV